MSSRYLRMTTAFGEALVLKESVPDLQKVDGVIFDIDGVLIDVRESIHRVHGLAAEMYFRSLGWSRREALVCPADVDSFKLAGGFNSDWNLAHVWQLLYLFKNQRYRATDGAALRSAFPVIGEFTGEVSRRGGGMEAAVNLIREMCSPQEWEAILPRWDRERLQRLFVEVYSGDLCPEVYGFRAETVEGPGMIRHDRPMLDRSLVPGSMKLGIATGRTAGETAVGIRLMGWDDLFPPERRVTEDDGCWKPDPRVLKLAVERTGADRPLYIGDTPDDLLTAERFNETAGRVLSCMVLSGFRGDLLKTRFVERRADVVADNVNVALAVMGEVIRR